MVSPERIRDLVEVRPHPTVVRLEHLDQADAAWLSERYHVTAEVKGHLHALREVLARPAGSGVFVIGQYGSGKSHLLAYLTQQIRGGRFVAGAAPRVATLSLLNFPAEATLEAIVCATLGLDAGPHDRRIAWSGLAAREPAGLVLILDELSEFLRSKPDGPAYNEDIRFLQFLGEWAQGSRLWIVGAMQEKIEHTGELEHGLYRKIKDRYPLRLLLTTAHVRDLVADSILVKKPGYDAAVAALSSRVREALPESAVDHGDLVAIYPIHPATLELLEEVRGGFSQARGVVDFVVARLSGDAARGIDPFLDEPWGSFLTPDRIVDHFHDLLAVQPEFLPLSQQLLPYYARRLPEMFPTDKARSLARRLLNLLVLTHVSPSRQGLSAAEAASFLLVTAARIEPEKNVQLVARLLRELVLQGRYLEERGGRFFVNLADDGAAELERALAREVAELDGRDTIVFEMLVPLLADDAFNPFALPADAWQRRTLRWHFHDRTYAVHFGNAAPEPQSELGLCIRLPWGQASGASGHYTLEPAPIELGPELYELAAMARLRERPLGRGVAARLDKRLGERRALFQGRIREAFAAARLSLPTGTRETPLPIDAHTSLDAWLARYGEWMLRRRYPSFERFAPGHGPLPKEAYRAFLRFCMDHDLGQFEADEHVKLIREAYLVPMGLLERRGRDYAVPERLDRNELVRLVTPLVEHRPAPRTVYEHLADSIFGLTHDQVHLLLLVLFLEGEIDLLKGQRSMRELHETLPTPLLYDTIAPGRALKPEAKRALEALCDALHVKAPKQWTASAERRAVQQLREAGRAEAAKLAPLLAKLGQDDRAPGLRARIGEVLAHWAALSKGDGEIAGLELFLYEIGSPASFLAKRDALLRVAERADVLSAELRRAGHLLGHPAVAGFRHGVFAARLDELGPPPDLAELESVDAVDAVDAWLARARSLYADYEREYRARHDAWWEARATHPIWSWEPPALSASRHLGLDEEREALRRCRERARAARCRPLRSLDYDPACSCGFDGDACPIEEELARFEAMKDRIETGLTLFFRQDAVRARVAAWKDEGLEMNPGTLAYLEGKVPVPQIDDLALFERHLGGVSLVKHVPLAALAGAVSGRTWERRELLSEIDRLLGPADVTRVRFDAREDGRGLGDELLGWCAEQALRHGVPLPEGLGQQAAGRLAPLLRPSWIGAAALQKLDALGLDEASVERALGMLVGGQLAGPPERHVAPVVAAALELVRPSAPETPRELAALAALLYTHHRTLVRVDRERWLARLDALADTPLTPAPPELTAVLREHEDASLLVIDCLGAALTGTLSTSLDRWFPGRHRRRTEHALVSPRTTTDAFYRQLAEGGPRGALEKIDAVDRLVHERAVPFDDLRRLAEAELSVALKRLVGRFHPEKAVLVFADHGFRMAADGQGYRHGGPSTLERLVPVIRLEAVGWVG